MDSRCTCTSAGRSRTCSIHGTPAAVAAHDALAPVPSTRLDVMSAIKNHLMVPDPMLVQYSLYIQAARGIVVKVTPTGDGHESQWSRLHLEVFSRTCRVDSVSVEFDSMLTVAKNDRPEHTHLYIWAPNRDKPEDWYIARPESFDPVYLMVNRFVRFWGNQEH